MHFECQRLPIPFLEAAMHIDTSPDDGGQSDEQPEQNLDKTSLSLHSQEIKDHVKFRTLKSKVGLDQSFKVT